MQLRNNTTLQIFLAMMLGIVAGLVLPELMVELKFIGDIFLRLIQMGIILLVMGSVIEAIGSLHRKEIGNLGLKALFGFALTTISAAVVGIVIANVIQPGAGIVYNEELTTSIKATDKTIAQIITDFFPSNIISSIGSGSTIQVIVFAILAGLASSIISESNPNNTFLNNIKSLNEILLQVIKLVMKIAPLGIFCLLGWVIGYYGIQVILPLFKFLLAFAIGMTLILAVFIFITATVVKVSPLKLSKKLLRMGVMAFTTTSSAITLPTKMADAEERIGVSKRVSRLINPLGMSLNSDGLAIYLALSCLTIAQFFNIEMSIQQQFIVVIMSTLATLGTVTVPGGGLVALAIVLPTVGLPIEGVALLAGIDWFSGMFRTVLNVIDDVLVALLVAHSENEFDREIFENTP
ncbi:dicarboxylate/amino acid:cation symporter [Mannheimia indoligenes]|uniref:Dicarboxylate/amino acid:cation symporter n=1 Tax=Mannheimia indoligenes TaxID=3103145 RepID=A0ABU7ZCZ3_9PAST